MEYEYTSVGETTYHCNIREGAGEEYGLASEIGSGIRFAYAESNETKAADGTSWYPVEYRMSEHVTVHGFLRDDLFRTV